MDLGHYIIKNYKGINMKILLGISGSIAAYKSADIVSTLSKDGYKIHPVLTYAASKFITKQTLQALSKNKVHTDILSDDDASQISHISLPQSCEIMLIAPATANIIAKIANGIADDILSTMALSFNGKIKILAPAMNTVMYNSNPVKRNIEILKEDGWKIINPRFSMLACGYEGDGAMANVQDIIDFIKEFNE